MGHNIRSGEFNFPNEQPLPGSDVIVPHAIVGDEVSRLTHRMMKPLPKNQACNDRRKRIFNYRLRRARRVSENAFGILCQTFRIFYSPISTLPETTDKITITTCCVMKVYAKMATHHAMRQYAILGWSWRVRKRRRI